MRIEFQVSGIPKGQPRPRAFVRKMGNQMVARVYDAGTAEGWKGCVALAAREHRPPAPLLGPITAAMHFRFDRPKSHYRTNGQLKPKAPPFPAGKPDVDNCAKAVMDAMKPLGFWKDDAQVVHLTLSKSYGEPGASIMLEG